MEFKRFLAENHSYSVSSKNLFLVSSRIFLKELSRRGFIPTDITVNVKCFKQEKKHKKEGITEDEASKIIIKMNSLPITKKNTRLKAIVALLMIEGLRSIEVIRMQENDISLISKTALIRGKGMADKTKIHLHPNTVKLLQYYIRKNNIKEGSPLFVSNSNNAIQKRITTRGLRMIVKKFLEEIGIHFKSLHSFRHYYVTRLVRHYQGDLLEVARLTRHKSLEMLQVYNDNIKLQQDLPRYYKTFNDIQF